jgi:hypothetical protein
MKRIIGIGLAVAAFAGLAGCGSLDGKYHGDPPPISTGQPVDPGSVKATAPAKGGGTTLTPSSPTPGAVMPTPPPK